MSHDENRSLSGLCQMDELLTMDVSTWEEGEKVIKDLKDKSLRGEWHNAFPCSYADNIVSWNSFCWSVGSECRKLLQLEAQ